MRIIRLVDALPPTRAGRHVADQLLRCGTSPLGNHGEVQGAESRKDFIHKLRICFKELREARRWLRLVHRVPLIVALEGRTTSDRNRGSNQNLLSQHSNRGEEQKVSLATKTHPGWTLNVCFIGSRPQSGRGFPEAASSSLDVERWTLNVGRLLAALVRSPGGFSSARPLSSLDVERWTLNVGRFPFLALTLLLAATSPLSAQNSDPSSGYGPPTAVPPGATATKPGARPTQNWIDQSQASADAKSVGCNECHNGIEPMHKAAHVVLGCTDCHGGNPARGLTKEQAHVLPQNKEFWKTSANPPNSNVWLNHESPEFIRFMNPGDLRVAKQACGLCHDEIVRNVDHSMMNHGAMLWGAALYNNGGFYLKNYRFGQAYGADGAPLRLINYTPVTAADTQEHGILPFLDPLPRFNLSNPGNILRIFEKGGERQLQLGVPTLDEPPGKPLRRLSERGLGTLNRTDPVFLGLQKTRLHDPLLGFLGSNDHPGDYRSSGCSACHVIYANDRSPTNSGWWSKYGHQGLSFTADKSIPKKERGHPITHQFTRSIPSSQCMNCHMHQGNLFVNPFLGYTWWDQETDGEFMYPKEQRNPTDDQLVDRNSK